MTQYHSEPPEFFARKPTAWEEELADTLQGIFASGVHGLDGIVAALNGSRVRPPEGGAWTEERFTFVLNELAQA